MRLPAVFLVFLLAVVGSPSEGRAEKVKTNQATSLLSRPGERGKVLLSVQEGKVMTVLAKDGRWLKVRVSGRTGWVPRSKVDVSDEIVRNTRRRPFVDGRGKDRGFGGEEGPEDRVGADAVGEGIDPADDPGDEPDDPEDRGGKSGGAKSGGGKTGGGKTGGGKSGGAKSGGGKSGGAKSGGEGEGEGEGEDEGDGDGGDDAVVVDEEEPTATRATAHVRAKIVALQEPAEDAEDSFAATPSMVLYPTGNKKGKYTEVENDDGDLGYVPTSSLEVDESSDDGAEGGGGAKGRRIDARARLGVTFFSQSTSPGGGQLSTSAVTIALGGAYTRPYKAKYVLGGEVTYDYAKAIPGVRNPGGMGNTSIGLHNLRLRALGGYDMKKPSGMTLFARLGLHYQSYQVANVEDLTKNVGKIPSEIITAPALGFGIQIPRLTQKIGLRGSLDAILFSSVAQTKNLEDGGSPAGRGALFEAAMTYHWRKDLDIVASYDLTYFAMSYGAAVPTSKRNPMTNNVSRGDQFHSFTVGVGKDF